MNGRQCIPHVVHHLVRLCLDIAFGQPDKQHRKRAVAQPQLGPEEILAAVVVECFDSNATSASRTLAYSLLILRRVEHRPELLFSFPPTSAIQVKPFGTKNHACCIFDEATAQVIMHLAAVTETPSHGAPWRQSPLSVVTSLHVRDQFRSAQYMHAPYPVPICAHPW